jgi:hypothetical protein
LAASGRASPTPREFFRKEEGMDREALDRVFQFKIGAMVAFRHVVERMEMMPSFPDVPTLFVVTERLLQQCYAATQLHYSLRGEGNKTMRWVTEPELVPYPFAAVDERYRKASWKDAVDELNRLKKDIGGAKPAPEGTP